MSDDTTEPMKFWEALLLIVMIGSTVWVWLPLIVNLLITAARMMNGLCP